MEEYSGSEKVMAEDESKDIKVKVVQSAAAKGMIYILLRTELPENQTFKKDQMFKYHLLKSGAEDDPAKKETPEMNTDRLVLVQKKENIGWFIYRAEREL